jgi:hypothetical protein
MRSVDRQELEAAAIHSPGCDLVVLALNRRLLHDETGMKTIGQITEIGVVSQ